MSQTTHLQLPFLAAAQAQKHVTVNETLLRLDALVQLSAKSATTSAEPASPSDGDLYILPAAKSGAAWGPMASGAIAYYRDGVWEQLTANPGWRCYVADEAALYARNASDWKRIAADAPLPRRPNADEDRQRDPRVRQSRRLRQLRDLRLQPQHF